MSLMLVALAGLCVVCAGAILLAIFLPDSEPVHPPRCDCMRCGYEATKRDNR